MFSNELKIEISCAREIQKWENDTRAKAVKEIFYE